MKRFFVILFFALCATASAQTIKTLGYNTTNGQVVYTNTNTLTFTNATVAFGAASFTNAAESRTNLGLGSASSVTFLELFIEDGAIYVKSGTNTYFYAGDDTVEIFTPVNIYDNNGIYFHTNNNSAANTRTNLGLGGGITATNVFVDLSTNTNTVTISNGIITSWTVTP